MSLDLFCSAAPGLEPLLLGEVRALGLAGEEAPGGVSLRGDGRTLLRLLLWLRTASRVLVRLGSFEATSFPVLVKRASALPFETVLRPGQPVALRVTCRKSRLYHSGAVAERVLGAIEARLGRASPQVKVAAADDAAEEPGAGPAGPLPQLLLVRFEDDRCTVSADASGDLLHRRGYRTAVSQAPLRETLAAGLLLAAGYQGGPLLDPCCGAGTLPIEAALIALGRAPGLSRSFACESWPGYTATTSSSLRDEARAQERPEALVAGQIRGSDSDPEAVAAASRNAARAGLGELLQFERRPVSELLGPASLPGFAPPGLVACNPPYGKRVGESRALLPLYRSLGELVRRRLPGFRAALICADEGLAAATGLGLVRSVRTQNGGLPVGLFVSPPAA